MKIKPFILFMAALLLCFGTLSCKQSDEPTATFKTNTYVADATNNDIPVSTSLSCPWTVNGFENSQAEKEKTVHLCGKEYTGTYTHSAHNFYTSYATDYYQTIDDIIFGVHCQTGALVELNVMNKFFYETESNFSVLENAEEYATAYATEIASTFIDLSSYTCRVTFYDDHLAQDEHAVDWYYVTFVKYINGWETMDCVTIRITAKGRFASFLAADIGAFDGFSHPDGNKETIDADTETLLNQIAQSSKVTLAAHNLKDRFLALTPNGTYVICSKITVQWKATDGLEYSAGYTVISEVGSKQPSP